VDAGALDVGVRTSPVREPLVLQVVARPRHAPVDHGLTRDALLQGLVRVVGPGLVVGSLGSRRIGPAQEAGYRIEEVDASTIGAQESCRLVHGALEDGRKVRRGADPCRDLAQGALDLGALRQLHPRVVERFDEMGVRHRRGGVIGERAHEGDL